MNKTQKLVQEQFLNNEEAVIRRLKSVYNQSLKDITEKTKELQAQIEAFDAIEGMATDPEELARIKSMKQSKVYQKQYQEALKKQVNGILDNMQVEEFKTVDSYLKKCYEDGFVGTMYDLHNQGIPIIMPLDQTAMVRAVQLDSKISQGLYTRIGEDVSMLKKKITATVSRSISTGISYQQAAKQLASYTNIGYNNAVRIARTEGHRIQVQSTMDACEKAKEKGADVVKQWDATLDANTRESHQAVDGEIRELDKPFSNGLMFPGDPSGGASEVVNCRCALLQRAKWALDDDELQTLKERAEFYSLDKTENFDDFKKKYLKAVNNFDAKNTLKITSEMSPEEIDRAGRINLYGHWEDYRKKFLGHASDVDFENIDSSMYDTVKLGKFKDSETVGIIFNKLNELSSKFYSPLQKLSFMDKTESKFSSAFASSSHLWGHGSAEIRFNPLKLRKEGIERISALSKKGYTINIPKGKEIEYLTSHEFGHCILNIGEKLPSKSNNFVMCDFTNVKKARNEIETIWDGYFSDCAKYEKEYKEFAKQLDSKFIIDLVEPTQEERNKLAALKSKYENSKISSYSLSNSDEFVAESFADVTLNGDNANQFSKKVYSVIEKYFGKV